MDEMKEILTVIGARQQSTKAGAVPKAAVMDPMGYLEMIALLKRCGLVLTGSVDVQKEAIASGKTCVTMGDQAECVELVDADANRVCGASAAVIRSASERNIGRAVFDEHSLCGGGRAASQIAARLAAV